MTTYNVHIYREMRLVYGGIVADSHEQAAAYARHQPTDQADSIDDCEGRSFSALVDVLGDEDYEQSEVIDFAEERQNQAAPKLLAALKAFIEADAMAEECGEWKRENLEHAFQSAREAIAEAEAAGVLPEPAAPSLRAALTWLLDDITDAAENRDPETGVEYDSVAYARAALTRSQDAAIPAEPVAARLLAVLKYALEFLEANDDGEEDVTSRIAAGQAAIAEAETAGIAPTSAAPTAHDHD
jgi:hypothetical protein